ncbi:MAG: FtsX-like permease family protein [Treponema sp.]|nr:FtsX-like permease family protein [Treponema sp.]
MRSLCSYAAKSVFRKKTRSLALILLVSASAAVLIASASCYDSLFSSASRDALEADGDILYVSSGKSSMDYESYRAVKEMLLSCTRVKEVRCRIAVDGIAGNSAVSAPVSGVATDSGEPYHEPLPASVGSALAQTLGVQEGDCISGLISDIGLTMEVRSVVKTESVLKDRFYIGIPSSLFSEMEENPDVCAVMIYLEHPLSAPRLHRRSTSPDYAAVADLCAGIPEFSSFELHSIPAGNTYCNKIISVYRTNYAVVFAVIMLTVVIAFLNIMSLSVYERSAEFGTMRSMGNTVPHIAAMILAETILVALISCAAAAGLSLAGSALINAVGGIVFRSPPGETQDILVGSSPCVESAAIVCGAVLLGAAAASLLSTLSLRGKTVLEQLEKKE